MFGQLKMDIAYGAVIYGLAVGKEDQIVVSGGQCDVKNIDIIYKDGREVRLKVLISNGKHSNNATLSMKYFGASG